MSWSLGHRGFSTSSTQAQCSIGPSVLTARWLSVPSGLQYFRHAGSVFRVLGLSGCGSWCSGLVSRQHVGSSRIRDQTCIFSASAGRSFPRSPQASLRTLDFILSVARRLWRILRGVMLSQADPGHLVRVGPGVGAERPARRPPSLRCLSAEPRG